MLFLKAWADAYWRKGEAIFPGFNFQHIPWPDPKGFADRFRQYQATGFINGYCGIHDWILPLGIAIRSPKL